MDFDYDSYKQATDYLKYLQGKQTCPSGTTPDFEHLSRDFTEFWQLTCSILSQAQILAPNAALSAQDHRMNLASDLFQQLDKQLQEQFKQQKSGLDLSMLKTPTNFAALQAASDTLKAYYDQLEQKRPDVPSEFVLQLKAAQSMLQELHSLLQS